MKKNDKPVVMPSAISAGIILWSGVFLLYFVAVLTCYLQWSRVREAREAAQKPKSTSVTLPYFAFKTPPGWEVASLTNDTAILRKKKGEAVPCLMVSAQRDPSFRYRALDRNPAIFVQMVDRALDQESYMPPDTVPMVSSVWSIDVRPGVHSVNGLFTLGEVRGFARYYYVGDVRYFCCSVWPKEDDDRISLNNKRRRLLDFFERMSFLDSQEDFSRPEVDSSRLSADEHAQTCRTMHRELALWRLYAARAKTEPANNLLPAIQHFRLGLAAAAAVREESVLVDSPEFATYRDLVKMRRDIVREWFVFLDKCNATGDLTGALKQAEFIVAHTTLEEEALDRRRAQKVCDSLAAKVQKTVSAK